MTDFLPIVHPRIEEYLRRIAPPRDPVLSDMEELARQRDFPIVGPLVGALLQVLARALGAHRVLELGSGFGYSAIWFARGMGDEGRVVATESDPSNAEAGRGFVARAALSRQIDFRVGDALETARRLEGPFDIIFNDVDKQDYPRSLTAANRLLRPGGMFISDNMLWRGSVVETGREPTTRGVQELTRLLYDSPEYLTTLIPLRDGVTLSLRVA
jgi:predicted O-methyltransferase YrrM